MTARANAGDLQDLRRADSTGAKNDFVASLNTRLLAMSLDQNLFSTPLFEFNLLDHGVRNDAQILARLGTFQIGNSGTAASAFVCGQLKIADTLLRLTIDVFIDGCA